MRVGWLLIYLFIHLFIMKQGLPVTKLALNYLMVHLPQSTGMHHTL